MSAPSLKKFSRKLQNLAATIVGSPRLALIRRAVPKAVRNRMRALFEKSLHRSVRFRRTKEWERGSNAAPPAIQFDIAGSNSSTNGINLYGYFSRWLGLGECARLYAHAMLTANYPVTLHDVDIDIPHDRRDQTLAPHMGERSFFTRDLIFVNPDHWEETLLSIDSRLRDKHYVIGYWFWELEKFPDEWIGALDQVDEIMVSSAFVEQALRKVTDKAITRVPMPIVLGCDSGLQRSHFGLGDDDYIFFCSFDFNSSIARKNPYAVIDAFLTAFPERNEQVTLLIKTSNGHLHTAALMRLIATAAADARILVRDDMLDRHDLQSLHRCIDVYVSLHRCEGFGLGMAEAMRMAKPVVATSYSGNMEYMTTANSCLVNYRLVEVKAGEYPYADGQHWADPDANHAAHFFNALYRDRSFGSALGARAKSDMEEHFSVDACMQVLTQRLQIIDRECDSSFNSQ